MQIDKSQFSPQTQKLIDLLLSTEWPEAVQPFLICADNEEEKTERAEGIVSFLEGNWQGKKVLDFGCGEGHVSRQFQKLGAKAYGYDVEKTGYLEWEKEGETLLTTNFSKIEKYKPFDYIILYDVLDHCTSPVDALKQVLQVSDPKTIVLVRCHSWMSRHGSHLYKKLNKAYIQLFFSEKELELMGLKPETVQKYHYPINTQKKWFEDAGFLVWKENVVQTFIEDFFKNPQMSALLPRLDNKYPEWQMSQAFNDYSLKIKT